MAIGLDDCYHLNLYFGHELLPDCQLIANKNRVFYKYARLHLMIKLPLKATVLSKISKSCLLIFLFFYNASKMIFEYLVFLLI